MDSQLLNHLILLLNHQVVSQVEGLLLFLLGSLVGIQLVNQLHSLLYDLVDFRLGNLQQNPVLNQLPDPALFLQVSHHVTRQANRLNSQQVNQRDTQVEFLLDNLVDNQSHILLGSQVDSLLCDHRAHLRENRLDSLLLYQLGRLDNQQVNQLRTQRLRVQCQQCPRSPTRHHTQLDNQHMDQV